jgi:hypothetical protein
MVQNPTPRFRIEVKCDAQNQGTIFISEDSNTKLWVSTFLYSRKTSNAGGSILNFDHQNFLGYSKDEVLSKAKNWIGDVFCLHPEYSDEKSVP